MTEQFPPVVERRINPAGDVSRMVAFLQAADLAIENSQQHWRLKLAFARLRNECVQLDASRLKLFTIDERRVFERLLERVEGTRVTIYDCPQDLDLLGNVVRERALRHVGELEPGDVEHFLMAMTRPLVVANLAASLPGAYTEATRREKLAIALADLPNDVRGRLVEHVANAVDADECDTTSESRPSC